MTKADPFASSALSAIMRTQDGRFVAAGSNSVIAVSADDGFHWHRARLEPADAWTDFRRVRQLASGVLYALGVSTLFRSDDGGESWRQLPRSWDVTICSPFRSAACDMAVSADGKALWVTSCDYNTKSDAASSGLYRTMDGVNWTCERFAEDGVFGAVAELSDGTIVLGNRGYIDRFDGHAWQGVLAHDVSDIIVDDGRVWLSTYANILVSADAGRTWSTVLQSERSISRMAVAGDVVCAVSGRNVVVSRDAGGSWRTHVAARPLMDVALSANAAIAVGADGAVERVLLATERA